VIDNAEKVSLESGATQFDVALPREQNVTLRAICGLMHCNIIDMETERPPRAGRSKVQGLFNDLA
jgi:hypothetical protein